MLRQLVQLETIGAADWHVRPVAIIGGGPSLRGFDLSQLYGRFIILAVNASIFDVPHADMGFTIDRRAARIWWRKFCTTRFPICMATPDPWLVHFSGAPTPNIRFVRRVQGTALTNRNDRISAGGTSGFGALHLAFLKGARKITLFGFDYMPSKDGVWHHNQHHYGFHHEQVRSNWAQWARNFDDAAPVLSAAGVEVINASPASAITAFKRVSINEALA